MHIYSNQVVSFLQKKGGAGKTTSLIAILTRMLNDGAKIACIDTDESKDLYLFCKKDKLDIDYKLVRDKNLIKPTISAMKNIGYDIIFTDTGGYESPISLYTIANSDLVIIPTKCDESSVRGAFYTYNTIKSVSENFEKIIPAYVLMCDVDIRTNIYKHSRNEFIKRNVPILKSYFGTATGMKSMLTWCEEPRDSTSKKYLDGVMCELQMNNLLYFYNETPNNERVA